MKSEKKERHCKFYRNRNISNWATSKTYLAKRLLNLYNTRGLFFIRRVVERIKNGGIIDEKCVQTLKRRKSAFYNNLKRIDSCLQYFRKLYKNGKKNYISHEFVKNTSFVQPKFSPGWYSFFLIIHLTNDALQIMN